MRMNIESETKVEGLRACVLRRGLSLGEKHIDIQTFQVFKTWKV